MPGSGCLSPARTVDLYVGKGPTATSTGHTRSPMRSAHRIPTSVGRSQFGRLFIARRPKRQPTKTAADATLISTALRCQRGRTECRFARSLSTSYRAISGPCLGALAQGRRWRPRALWPRAVRRRPKATATRRLSSRARSRLSLRTLVQQSTLESHERSGVPHASRLAPVRA